MKKSDLISAVADDNPKLLASEIETLISTFFEEIVRQLEKGGRVEIRGFGVFETRGRDARSGLNPRTGHSVKVKAKRIPFFKPAKTLRQSVGANKNLLNECRPNDNATD
jgi:integration host factor subunit beta